VVDIAPALLDDVDRRLIEAWQRGFPLVAEPYAAIAATLGIGETELLQRLARLEAEGVLSRVGAVVAPHRTGWSTLAAMAVPEARLEAVAAAVSARPEVNHNYARQHRLNLWFVVTAASRYGVAVVLADVRRETGIEVLDLPLERAYGIDLGFKPSWT
jgi:DNA-binding Lrp family transcriptional regulator